MPTPPSSPTPVEPAQFRPENFKKKSGFRDYLIYLVLLVVLLGVGGGAYYYFKLSPAEQRRLQAKVGRSVGEDEAGAAKQARGLKRKQLDAEGNPEGEPAPAAPASERPRPAEAVSVYGGGGQSLVLPSTDPKRPQARSEFVKFLEKLRVSGVLQGTPAKAMLNGRMFRAGAVVEPEMGIVFVGADSANKVLLFRDQTGAELQLTY